MTKGDLGDWMVALVTLATMLRSISRAKNQTAPLSRVLARSSSRSYAEDLSNKLYVEVKLKISGLDTLDENHSYRPLLRELDND